jgi:hypothetical protein
LKAGLYIKNAVLSIKCFLSTNFVLMSPKSFKAC